MMRRCGGALMGQKEQEGLGRTARWGRQARGRRRKRAEIFWGERRTGKRRDLFWKMHESLEDGWLLIIFCCVSNYKKAVL
jgi:hypothetical protein